MQTVTAHIDVSRPTGRRLVRELEKHRKVAKVDYPLPASVSGKWYTLEEVMEETTEILSKHYGVDFRNL